MELLGLGMGPGSRASMKVVVAGVNITLMSKDQRAWVPVGASLKLQRVGQGQPGDRWVFLSRPRFLYLEALRQLSREPTKGLALVRRRFLPLLSGRLLTPRGSGTEWPATPLSGGERGPPSGGALQGMLLPRQCVRSPNGTQYTSSSSSGG